MNYHPRDGRIPVRYRRVRVHHPHFPEEGISGYVDLCELYRNKDGDYRWQLFLIEEPGERNRYELLSVSWEYEDKTLLPCGYHFPCPCDP